MSLNVLIPPAQDPVNLAETRVFLQLDSTYEDTLVTDLIRAANETVERITGVALITRTLRQSINQWPDKGGFALQGRPLNQLIEVRHVDGAGAISVIASTKYYVDIDRSRLIALSSFPRPTFTHPAEQLQMDFTAGYGPDETSIPAPLRMAILLIVRDLYEHRGEHDGALPLRAQALLAPFTEMRL
jgi:uncharacterized phiE125 gp8 family phage protein